MFSSECLGVDFSSTGLILTEPYFDFCSIQENLTEIFFEDYGVQSLCVINPSSLVAYKYHQVSDVVEYSFFSKKYNNSQKIIEILY